MSVQAGRSVRFSALLVDAFATARARATITVTLLVTIATVTSAILLTTGQSAAAERAVLSHIDSAGTRLIAVSDRSETPGILPAAVAQLGLLSDVTWVFGLGRATDVQHATLPDEAVALRPIVGDVPSELGLNTGRMPRPGEAIVGSRAAVLLRAEAGFGTLRAVDGSGAPVALVGAFRATGPLDHLNDVVLMATEPTHADPVSFLYVLASDVTTVHRLSETLPLAIVANDPAALEVEEPSGVVALREVIAGQLGARARQLMALVIAVGGVIIAGTLHGATAQRRKDFGRKRALGATTHVLVLGVLLHVSVGALAGIALGVTIGLLGLTFAIGVLPSATFVCGVAGLAYLTALLAATPVAIAAARTDPLTILRVP